MLAARRAVDDENARYFIGIVMPPLACSMASRVASQSTAIS
jgi:hypothetical protein